MRSKIRIFLFLTLLALVGGLLLPVVAKGTGLAHTGSGPVAVNWNTGPAGSVPVPAPLDVNWNQAPTIETDSPPVAVNWNQKPPARRGG